MLIGSSVVGGVAKKLLKQRRLDADVIGCYRRTSKKLKRPASKVKAERFVWATVVQLFPFVGIDVIHHFGHILLSQFV